MTSIIFLSCVGTQYKTTGIYLCLVDKNKMLKLNAIKPRDNFIGDSTEETSCQFGLFELSM